MENFDYLFKDWKKQIENRERPNVVCKPCWELKYCPYGVLVEEFPVGKRGEFKDCIIYNHECPVFYVAEPFTETKERRRVTRNISAVVRRRVDRKDDMHCQICNQHIRDNDVNYDHIIPWSLGGSSDESNIRLLCSTCNKKRGNKYQEEYLKKDLLEDFPEIDKKKEEQREIKLEHTHILDLLNLYQLWLSLKKECQKSEIKTKFMEIIANGKNNQDMDEFMFSLIVKLDGVFEHIDNVFSVKKKSNIVWYRWGNNDGRIHSVNECLIKFNIEKSYYYECEQELILLMGFDLSDKVIESEEYLNYVPFNINVEGE